MTLAHLTLATRDVPVAARFFEATLGWRPIPVPNNTPLEAAWLQIAPDQQLHLLRVDDFETSDFEREFGRHTAVFHNGDDMEDLKRRIVEHGGELIDPIRDTPFERFFFKDPNGYVFEVINQSQYVTE